MEREGIHKDGQPAMIGKNREGRRWFRRCRPCTDSSRNPSMLPSATSRQATWRVHRAHVGHGNNPRGECLEECHHHRHQQASTWLAPQHRRPLSETAACSLHLLLTAIQVHLLSHSLCQLKLSNLHVQSRDDYAHSAACSATGGHRRVSRPWSPLKPRDC